MKRKLWIVIAACLVLAVVLIIVQHSLSKDKTVKEPATTGKGNAQTGEEEEEVYTFGFSCADMEDPYYAALEASLRAEIVERGGLLSTKNAHRDQETQNRDLEDFAKENVTAIFVVPVTPEGAGDTLRSIQVSEIPVIVLDSKITDDETAALYIATDQENAGELCAADLIRRAPDGGNLLIVESAVYMSEIEAVSGFEKELAGHGFEVIGRLDAQGSSETAKAKMKGLLEKRNDITAIACASDKLALGVLAALEEYNRSLPEDKRCKPFIYGIGGTPQFKSKLSDASTLLTGTAAAMPVSVGQAAAEAVFSLIGGEEPEEEEVLLKPYLIDRENIDLYGKDGWQ